jgi:hypothetical protein
MNEKQVKSAIGVLVKLFYSDLKNGELAFLTMEQYIDDLNMLKDVRTVATELEKQRAFSLLAPMKYFDLKSAEKIEDLLKGV